MTSTKDSVRLPVLATIDDSTPRKTWHAPKIEDSDIRSITKGSGTSGMEGTSFLKAGS